MTATTAIAVREFNGKAFEFRADGWINMTKAAKAFGKDQREFFKNASTKAYLTSLAEMMGIPLNSLTTAGRGANGGTWGHHKLAVFFARWLDEAYAAVSA